MMPGEKPETLTTFQDGMGLGLTILFCVNRTVQIWSRLPGTTGDWFYGWMFAGGLGISAWYYEANVQASQAMDFISWKSTAISSGMWFGVHGVVRAIRQLGGLRLHSYEPGVGLFDWYLSRYFPRLSGIISDLAVAIGLGIAFKLLGSPIQSSWYFAMCLWMLLGHLWIGARDARNVQIWVDRQQEASDWSHRMKQ